MSSRIEFLSNWGLPNIGYLFICSTTEFTQYVLNYIESIRNWVVASLPNPITHFFSVLTRISPETIDQYFQTEIIPRYESLNGKLSKISDPKEYQEIITLTSQLIQSTLQANAWLYQTKSYLSSHNIYLQSTTTIEKVHLLITSIFDSPISFSTKPVLIANEGNTCFINVVLQLFFTAPALFEHVIKELPFEYYLNVKTLALQYKIEQALEAITPTSSKKLPGSKKAREDLALQGNFSLWGQEDSHEALCTLFKYISPKKDDNLHPLYNRVEMKKKLEGIPPIYHLLSEVSRANINEEGFLIRQEEESITSLPVCNKATAPIDFEELLLNYFNEKMDSDSTFNVTLVDGSERSLPILDNTKRYLAPPEHLLYHFNRTTYDLMLKKVGKNNRPINLLPNFTLPSSLTLSEEEGMYQIDGFASHEGLDGNDGHYVAYTRSSDGKWYYLNDISSGVTEITDEQDVIQALKTCYFFYANLKGKTKKPLENPDEICVPMEPIEEKKVKQDYTWYDKFVELVQEAQINL